MSWLQPGARFGMFQIELRATGRNNAPRLGRSLVAVRDWKHKGIMWSFEAGDTYFSPGFADYHLTNLSTPGLTFAGLTIAARATRWNASLVAGRATAWRNIFGTDAVTLDQDIGLARVRFKPSDRLDLTGRASHVRTKDLGDFVFTVARSDQAGVGARMIVRPSVQLVADGSYISYARADGDPRQRDVSALAGTNVLLSRGWIQANVSRFSPGDFPVLNQPLIDRQTFFTAGEYDVARRLRVSGGVEGYRSNLRPDEVPATQPAREGVRGFGAIRVQFLSRSTLGVRAEAGDRRARFVGPAREVVSDDGLISAEWQTAFGRLTGFARYARRDNVEALNTNATYTQHEGMGQVFLNLNRKAQLFGTLTGTRFETIDKTGSTFWQAGGGGQAQLRGRSLWLRAEGAFSRNTDLLTRQLVPRESLTLGLNGQIARNTVVGLNVYADHLRQTTGDDWITRSLLRVTRSFPTGTVRVPSSTMIDASARTATGTVTGSVFEDWNANGMPDPEDTALEGIPVRLSALGDAATSREGSFAFLNVPVGLQLVGVDTSSLPVDFDPPEVSQVQIELGRGDTKWVSFGLIPLGSVYGRVVHDKNGNGRADEGEPSLNGAVLVLDGGARSEQVRRDRFRFDAVRSGPHTIELLPDSLPEGAAIVGSREDSIMLGRGNLSTEIQFLVVIRSRPEVRKVFPSASVAPTPRSEPPATRSERGEPVAPVRRLPAAEPSVRPAPPRVGWSSGGFALQVGAFRDPLRAYALQQELDAAGYVPYIVASNPTHPEDSYFRVRVGFRTRAELDKAVATIEAARGDKVWVIPAPPRERRANPVLK